MNSLWKNAIAFWLCSASFLAAQSAIPTAPNQEKSCVVVLRNGQVIEGCTSADEESLEIITADGTRLILSNEQVNFCCPTMTDAYWGLVARTKASDVEGQIEVLAFCLRNLLLAEADNQIDILLTLPIKASRLEYLHRQLQVAKTQVALEKEKHDLALAERNTLHTFGDLKAEFRPLPAMNKNTSSGLQAAVPNLGGMNESRVAHVGFNQPLPSAEETATGVPTNVISQDELDRVTDSLPKHSIVTFKRKIEPMLTRSCFATGCHGPDSSEMPVMRLSAMRVMPRKMSQRNLHSIITFADPNVPLESSLLTMAGTAHGGGTEPALKPGSAALDTLARWLIGISNQPTRMHTVPPWMYTQQDSTIAAKPEPIVDLPEAAEDETGEPDFRDLPPALRLEVPEPEMDKPGVPEKKSPDPVGRDPFDADVFNRKYGKSKK